MYAKNTKVKNDEILILVNIQRKNEKTVLTWNILTIFTKFIVARKNSFPGVLTL